MTHPNIHGAEFFKLSQDLLCIADTRGGILEANPAWQSALGWTIQEMRGQPLKRFVHPDDEPTLATEIERLSRGLASTRFECRCQHKDGGYRWLLWQGNLEPNQSLIYAAARDVTAERELEHRLQDQQKVLEAIVDNLPVAVFAKDVRKEYSFVVWNKTANQLFGLRKEDLIGRTDYDIFPKEQADFFRKKDRETVEGETRVEIPEEFLDTPNGRRTLNTIKVPVRLDESSPSLLLGITMDITEKKRMESLIAEQQAQMITTAKFSSLGEMAGGIAHEINNPLAVILGKASQLSRRLGRGPVSEEELLRGLHKIEETCGRIVKIINGLRSFSRSGEKDPFARVSLSTLVGDTLEFCRERFRTHGIELRVNGNLDQQIECRGTQIAQVLLNLLNNALDANHQRQLGWVEVAVVASATVSEAIQIRVSDSGAGIAPEIVGKIMQPFFTTKEVGKGTGLGLSIAQGIVEDHGGRLLLDRSSPNTCFVIELPIRQNESSSKAA